MARARTLKAQLRAWLSDPQWNRHVAEISRLDGREAAGPLLSLLPHADLRNRAAVALGMVTAGLAEREPEAARNLMRRLMWHMNEESGNIGWGIPEAFAEILARSPLLAGEFHRILLSYIVDTGHDDNYCDHAVLRRSCYWAVGRLARDHPELCQAALPSLILGLEDADVPFRGFAAWALGQFPAPFRAVPALRRLAESGEKTLCEVFDGEHTRSFSVGELARQALGPVGRNV